MSEKKKKKPITVDEVRAKYDNLFGALKNDSDLICAIVTTSFLDNALIALFDQVMRDGNTKTELFRESGALGSIMAKANIAYCLGLIPTEYLTNIKLICEIRNKFAHEIEMDFSSEEISKKCKALLFPDFTITGGEPIPDEVKDGLEKKPRYKFMYVCSWLCVEILNKGDLLKKSEISPVFYSDV